MEENLFRFDKDSTFIFLDFETYNLCLNFCMNLPWQLGMLRVKNNIIEESFDRFIKWKTHLKMGVEAARVTKFDQKKFDASAVDPDEVFPIMEKWLDESTYIIGHNLLGFDIYLVKEWYKLKGKDPQSLFNKFIDTNIVAKAIKFGSSPPDKNKPLLAWQYPIFHRKQSFKTRLEALGKEYEIEHNYETLHDATSDLELNFKVWQKQKATYAI